MLTPQFQLDIRQELIVDLFAGGGGMSSAIEHATGLHPDIACNHDADAISMHEANHPHTEHFQADVYELCPKAATQGRPVGLLHLSPDCTHHSQAAGGQPRNKATRSLSWVGKRWAGQAKPRVITLENVKEIQKWGPLVAKRCKKTGRVLKLDGSVAAPGEVVPVNNQHLIPNPKKQGQTWKRFVHCLRELGYQVEWRLLIAADFGAPPPVNAYSWSPAATASRLYGRNLPTAKLPPKPRKNGAQPLNASTLTMLAKAYLHAKSHLRITL